MKDSVGPFRIGLVQSADSELGGTKTSVAQESLVSRKELPRDTFDYSNVLLI